MHPAPDFCFYPMSTLPGGPADKAGNLHEALWGVFGMVTVVSGQAEAIRIEEPGTDGAEFFLEKLSGHEHWQAKRQILSQSTWTLKLLAEKGVLGFFRQRVDAGESCVFASISDAPELRGLSENALDAADWAEFDSKFLLAKEWRANFDQLKKYVDYETGELVFKFLRKVSVQGARESTLEALLLPVFKTSFTGAPETVLALLRDLYLTSIHKKLTKRDILQRLEKPHGIKFRDLPVSAEVGDSVEGVTASETERPKSKINREDHAPPRSSPEGQNVFNDTHLTENLLALFSDDPGPNILVQRMRFQTAFLNLVGLFTLQSVPALHGHIGVDHVALQGVMERFHRDAFGVKWFARKIRASDNQLISEQGKLFVLHEIQKLGIRVNTDSPRLTRVAAAFSFWLSVLRPIHVKMSGITQPDVDPHQVQHFCGMLNFWIASAYLSLFGKITLSDDRDPGMRLQGILYDLTYGKLNFSSLALLYGSIFRPHMEAAARDDSEAPDAS